MIGNRHSIAGRSTPRPAAAQRGSRPPPHIGALHTRTRCALLLCTPVLSTAALCGVLAGCSSSADKPPPTVTAPSPPAPPAGPGSLAVTISPANGTMPVVVIAGPGGYSKTIGTTQTLNGLTVGTYTIVADSAVGPDSIVGSIIDTGTVTGSPATVTTSNGANVSVSYTMKGRVGGLWIANNAYPTIPEYSATQLRASGGPVPAETLATRASNPAGLTLDANGNMWVSSFTSDSLAMYTPTARHAGGGTPPSRYIISAALTHAENLAVDAAGNLWVANCDGNLLAFSPSQLAAGGTQTPTVVIGGSILNCPWALAFDGDGNLWVGDDDSFHVIEYSAAQLATSGSPTPADTIGHSGDSPNDITGLAFDASGNLWVVSESANLLTEYTPGQLAASGSPIPTTIIGMPSGADLFGAAFDQRGTLWISDNALGVVYGMASIQLTGSGMPTPAVTITGVGLGGQFQPEQPMFDPTGPTISLSTDRVRGATVSTRHAHLPKRNRPPHHLR